MFAKSLFIGGCLLLSCTGFAGEKDDLIQAERDISAGRYAHAALLLKDILINATPGQDTETRALNLVDSIYEATAGAPIPVDYDNTFPDELKGLKIVFARRLRRPDETKDGQPGDHVISIDVKKPGLKLLVRQIKLIRPSRSSSEQINLKWSDQNGLIADDLDEGKSLNGLYLLQIKFNDATSKTYWFIVTRALASNDAIVSAPGNFSFEYLPPDPEITYNPADLKFAYETFTSNQYRTFEKKSLLLSINYHLIGGGQSIHQLIQPYFDREIQDPRASDMQFQAGKEGVPILNPGEYRFAPHFQEIRGFGPLSLIRESSTVVRYFVGPEAVSSCDSITDEEKCDANWERKSGLCVSGWKDENNVRHACVGTTQTSPISGQCSILKTKGACDYHNVSCIWAGTRCELKHRDQSYEGSDITTPSQVIRLFTDEFGKINFTRTPEPSGTVFTRDQQKSWTLLRSWTRISGFDYPDGTDETNTPAPVTSGPFPRKKEVRLYSSQTADHQTEYHVIEGTIDDPSDPTSSARDNVARVYDASPKKLNGVPVSFTYYNTINGDKAYQEICRISTASPDHFLFCRIILKGEWFNYQIFEASAP